MKKVIPILAMVLLVQRLNIIDSSLKLSGICRGKETGSHMSHSKHKIKNFQRLNVICIGKITFGASVAVLMTQQGTFKLQD